MDCSKNQTYPARMAPPFSGRLKVYVYDLPSHIAFQDGYFPGGWLCVGGALLLLLTDSVARMGYWGCCCNAGGASGGDAVPLALRGPLLLRLAEAQVCLLSLRRVSCRADFCTPWYAPSACSAP
jgi:hypothetical protein